MQKKFQVDEQFDCGSVAYAYFFYVGGLKRSKQHFAI